MGETTDPSGRAGPRREERPIQVSSLSARVRGGPCDGLTPVTEEGRGSVMWHTEHCGEQQQGGPGREQRDQSASVWDVHIPPPASGSERRAERRERAGGRCGSSGGDEGSGYHEQEKDRARSCVCGLDIQNSKMRRSRVNQRTRTQDFAVGGSGD